MRILVDGRILRTERPTGVERSLRTLLRGLAEVRDDHDVLLAGAPEEETWGLRPRVRPVPAVGRLRTGRLADVLLSPVTAVPPLGPLPRVATIHDLPWLSGAPPERREWRHRLRARLTGTAAAGIVVPSRTTAEALARLPGLRARVRVVPPGIHPDVLRPAGEEARRRVEGFLAGRPGPVILGVGAVRRRKALDLLLEAHARLHPATLVLAGPGTAVFARRTGVVTAGFVDDGTLRALYERADVLVHPAWLEGAGLVVLEAMARGVPVVATRSPGVEETAGDAALLVAPGDPDALAAAVERVVGDADLRATLVARGRERAADRTPEAQAEGVLDLLREVVEEEQSRE